MKKMKPILFSTPMVQAILDGRKTMTRRIVKPQPSSGIRKSVFVKSGLEDGHGREIKPRYQPSDILWVRETWCKVTLDGHYAPNCYQGEFYYYKADGREIESCGAFEGWRPSIFMPREAARIFLRVTNVRVERLQDITLENARAEGFDSVKGFITTWNQIYGNWGDNPWIWVYEFERVDKPGEECRKTLQNGAIIP